MKIAILGQGYVGRALGLAAYNSGHEVSGIDTDEFRCLTLTAEGPYEVKPDYSAIANSSVVVIAVPTPLDNSMEPDLSHLEDACDSMRIHLKPGTLIVNESTSYPGTLRNLISRRLGDSFLYAVAPERIDPANENWTITNTPRLVSGLNELASKVAEEFYRTICQSVQVVSSPEVAEAAKLFENTFRQVNIALVNEFARITHALGISSHEVLSAAATKPFGFMKFVPSLGVGGHCIPVDPTYLNFAANRVGVDSSFIRLANEVNREMPAYVAGRIREIIGEQFDACKIQIAGISYKANVPDLRESPSLILISLLREMGANVCWHDDVVGTWKNEKSTEIQEVDVGIIATHHTGVNFDKWKTSKTVVFDVSTYPNSIWPKLL